MQVLPWTLPPPPRLDGFLFDLFCRSGRQMFQQIPASGASAAAPSCSAAAAAAVPPIRGGAGHARQSPTDQPTLPQNFGRLVGTFPFVQTTGAAVSCGLVNAT